MGQVDGITTSMRHIIYWGRPAIAKVRVSSWVRDLCDGRPEPPHQCNAVQRNMTLCSDHISPVLRQLHWLPVRQRVNFKVATLVHQLLSGISPPYLDDDCRNVADARERRLRSAASRTCVVTRTYSTFGDRAFGAVGPGLWNSLPSHLKDADISYSEFCLSLKTFLFGQWGHGAV